MLLSDCDLPARICPACDLVEYMVQSHTNPFILVFFTHPVLTGKGILAVDESTKTIGKRLEGISVENTEANRQAYRGLLFTTPNIGNYISGAILYEETLFQVRLTLIQCILKCVKV